MSFYYFVASLPMISLTAPPPLTTDAFMADARRLLDRETVAELEALMSGAWDRAGGAFAARWRDAETQLRNALARARAVQQELDPTPYLRPHAGFSVYVEQAVVEAYAKANPLERELSLDRFRWALLEEWARTNPFGRDAVLAYGMKLALAHRWAALSDEKGRARFEATVQAVRGTEPKGQP